MILLSRLLLRSLLLLIPFTVAAESPTPVQVGVKVDQITGIDQKAENFSAVISFMLRWHEPALAGSGEKSRDRDRLYLVPAFLRLMEEKDLPWPNYTFFNRQGRTDIENETVSVDPDGNVIYFARFTATFQAPDFDFTRFPLDYQVFRVIVDSLRPDTEFVFEADAGRSGLGNALGEEEWILEFSDIRITSHDEMGYEASRFILSFEGGRHLNYYVVRILVPTTIIILVSWFTFFLKDYTKRIDLAAGNLLLFIAFNFTVANDLPRLGYLTLMDTFMLGTFIVTAMVVLANVLLRRLQNLGRTELVEKVDRIGIWAYPLLYLGAGVVMFYSW